MPSYPRKSKKMSLFIWAACAVVCVVAVLYLYTSRRVEIIPHEDEIVAMADAGDVAEAGVTGGNTPAEAVGEDCAETAEACLVPEPITGKIQSGDTAANLLKEWLSAAEIHALAATCKGVHPLERLRVGQPYTIEPMAEGTGLRRFEYEIDGTHKLVVLPDDNGGYAAELQTIVYEVEFARLSGEIRSSLFQTVHDMGEQAGLAVALADIFAWEVDFIRDIRVGDAFALLVEKRYRDGEFKGYGPILAANFVNQGQMRSAYLFVDAIGNHHYFAEDGSSMRRAFLKAPLSFTRISSGFSYNRRHPIYNDVRAHEGIDYAAPMGTPVKSVGSGTVQFAAVRGGYGKLIIVRHANGYETYYAHLSKYAQGLAKGTRVNQGEVIGYVGMTGTATGPHLDFRIKKDGSFINPSSMTNPRTEPVDKALRPAFERRVALLTDILNNEGADPLLLAELEPLPAL